MRLLFFILLTLPSILFAKDLPLHLLKLPPGFAISIYAHVPGAREMALGPDNNIFVGSIDAGKVYLVKPDSKAIEIADGLNMPNGVAYHNNNLYVAALDKLYLFKEPLHNLSAKPSIINSSLPNEHHHGWRYIQFGPDGKLYVGIGAPCNNCLREDPRFASIIRMSAEGKQEDVYAKGVRNTVGFDWDTNNNLWFTDNGRDWLGDDSPPDEINQVTKAGQHFGFPYCHGKNISDPKFGKDFPCTKFVAPIMELPAHAAALGMKFYKAKQFPENYWNNIFVAEHGSWNRSTKVGYQIVSVNLNNKKVTPFITGWLQGESEWGRPVDILVMPDGSLLISDDYAGVIYKVTYKK